MTYPIKMASSMLILFLMCLFQVEGQNPQLQVEPSYPGQGNYVPATRDILYSQLGQPSDEQGVHSQYYNDFPTFTCQGADDFIVPPGIPWMVDSLFVTGYYSEGGGPAEVAHVYFFQNDGGIPGSQIFFYFALPVVADDAGNLGAILDPPLELPEGHYWLSVQPVMSFNQSGQWLWNKQTDAPIESEYHWRNPGGGFGIPGAETWIGGSQIDWGGGTQEDLNLSFALYGQPAIIPPEVSGISDETAYPGQNLRLWGSDFGEYTVDCAVEINGMIYHDAVTFWNDENAFFNLPDVPEGMAEIRLVKDPENFSEPLQVYLEIPSEVIFLTPKEDAVISGNTIEISAAAEIYQELINIAIFYYRPANSGTWTQIGIDVDGSSKHYSTTGPIGSGNGWSIVWDVSGIEEMDVVLKVDMVDQFGNPLTGQRTIRIDKTPLAPFISLESSKTFTGQALDNDSISFDLEVSEDNTGDIELRWAPPPVPIGGWNYERELEPIDQDEVEFVDRNGNDVSGMACGPSAMASCLKWLSQLYPESETAGMTVDSLAQILARNANTGPNGTSDADLEQAAQDQLDNDPGITTPFDVERHYNSSSSKNGSSHNVYNDIAANLRDSADVVMLLYQVGPNGDTLGHYVTASSHHVEISYVHTNEYCAAVQTSYVDFMDPATGERVEKIINWYDNPPQIQDYDLHPDAQGNAWVEMVTTIKPKNSKRNATPGELITQIPVNGPGNYTISVSGLNLPEGVQILQLIGVDFDGNTSAAPMLACANGPYQPLSNFSAEPRTFLTGYPIQFTDLSNPADSIVEWQWDFGDMHTSSDQNPQHIYDQTGTYTISLVVSDGNLSDTLVRENYIEIIEGAEQTIAMSPGWHGLSGYVEPVEPAIEQVMDPIIDQLIILQETTSIFWPAQNINTIGNWNSHKGYKIKVSAPANLELRGMSEADKILDLNAGWTVFPVLSSCNVPTSVITSQLEPGLVIMKDIAGTGVLWPDQGINTLNVLVPGKAYCLLLDQDSQITFPACDGSSSAKIVSKPMPEHPWNEISETAGSHVISLAQESDILPNHTFIGAFDQNGRCCGVTEYSRANPSALVVFADDPTTPEKEGFIPEEYISYRILDPLTGKSIAVQPDFDESYMCGSVFAENGVSVIVNLNLLNTTEILHDPEIRVYPTPAGDVLNINGLQDGSLITLLDLFGREMLRLTNPEHMEQIDVSNLPSGIYILRIQSGENIIKRKIVLE